MKPISPNSNLSHQVTESLGRAIVNARFAPEDSLPTEAQLCKKFGVSRTAVREAVKMLAAKGLVSSKPRRGIRVLPARHWNIFDADLLTWSLEGKPSHEVMREFFQLRVAVEPEAAALAARYATPEHKAAIGAALERMQGESGTSENDIEADLDFHVALLYATENRFYIRLRNFIRTALNVSVRFTTPAQPSYAEVLAAHRRVFEAIEAGDSDTARSQLRTLIEGAFALIDETS
jgi:DNA-binding FadR family transcriptional regulator